MSKMIDVLLLLALPASGKAELTRYLAELPPEACRDEFHLGPTVRLGDYSYVHLMRRISVVLRSLGRDGVFYEADERPMKEPRDWGMLTELVNDDFDDLLHRRRIEPDSAAAWLLERFDAARVKCGAEPELGRLPAEVREKLVLALEAEAQELLALKNASIPSAIEDRTVVIEISRGGPQGAAAPLPDPLGYQYSLSRFSDAILSQASILYIWVTPEESRRRNARRAGAGPDGDQSLLHHGVPLAVMLSDYGMDDMDYLIRTSGVPDAVRIETRGRTHRIPVGRFDNRVDKTSFLREARSTWPADRVSAVHRELGTALARIEGAAARAGRSRAEAGGRAPFDRAA